MIRKKEVREFLNRKLDSFVWMKKISKDEIMEAIAALPGFTHFKTDPFFHQLVCFYIGACRPEFLFFLDMGLGKTKIILDILTYRMQLDQVKKSLILVPNDVNVENWVGEVRTHSDLKSIAVIGSGEERKDLIVSQGDIFLLSYYGLQALMTRKDPSGKGRLIPDDRIDIKKLFTQFQFVNFDEIQKAKNHESLTYKLCRRVSKVCEFIYALTGTPFGRDPQDLWTEFHLVDKGATLGDTLGMMRQAFFLEEDTFWSKQYVMDKKKTRLFYNRLQHRSIAFFEDECADLPKCISVPIELTMTSEMRKPYEELINGMIAAGGNFIEAKGIFTKMRMLCSGHLKFEDEDGEERQVVLSHIPKMEWLKSFLQNLPDDEKVVIVYEFTKTGEFIDNVISELKIKNVWLHGGLKDPISLYRRFQTDPSCRIMNMNWRCGGTGLNLQTARYMIYIESPVSPIDRRQTDKRCHRIGQTRRTFIYDVYMKGSKEEQILEFLAEGKDLHDELVKGKVK